MDVALPERADAKPQQCDTAFTVAYNSMLAWSTMRWFHKKAIKDKQLLQRNKTQKPYNRQTRAYIFWKVSCYLLPQPQSPLTKPEIPAGFVFLVASSLSSSDGYLTRFRARSKKSGLHGTGHMSGGSFTTLGCLVAKAGSSRYSSSRSTSGTYIKY